MVYGQERIPDLPQALTSQLVIEVRFEFGCQCAGTAGLVAHAVVDVVGVLLLHPLREGHSLHHKQAHDPREADPRRVMSADTVPVMIRQPRGGRARIRAYPAKPRAPVADPTGAGLR